MGNNTQSLIRYDRAKQDAQKGNGKILSPLLFKIAIDEIVPEFKGLDIPTTIFHAIGGGFAVQHGEKYIILPLDKD